MTRSHYEHHYMKPRPRAMAAELVQSRYEQQVDMAGVGGLSGVREIRKRIAAMGQLKRKIGERAATLEELDEVLPPVGGFRDRTRLGLFEPDPEPEPEPVSGGRLRKPLTLAKRREYERRKQERMRSGDFSGATVRRILETVGARFRPGDRVTLREVGELAGIESTTASYYVRGLILCGMWPYARGKGGPGSGRDEG